MKIVLISTCNSRKPITISQIDKFIVHFASSHVSLSTAGKDFILECKTVFYVYGDLFVELTDEAYQKFAEEAAEGV